MEIVKGNSQESMLNIEENVSKYDKRLLVDDILYFLLEDDDTRFISILNGLPMTGKTTSLQHAMINLPEKEQKKSAYINIDSLSSWDDLKDILNKLRSEGFKYIFLDEITSNMTYITRCKELPEIFSKFKNLKIVCAGSNSLSIYLSLHTSLAAKAIPIDTSYISYAEWKRLLEKDKKNRVTIDDYIEHGGILGILKNMPIKNINFKNFKKIWLDDKNYIDQYINRSIAENIQNAIKYFDAFVRDEDNIYKRRFKTLKNLLDNGLLTDAIQRIVANNAHKIIADIFNQKLYLPFLRDVQNNLELRRSEGANKIILQCFEDQKFITNLNYFLGIKNQGYIITEEQINEITSYLKYINILTNINVRSSIPNIANGSYICITQPGLRYQLCKGVIDIICGNLNLDKINKKNEHGKKSDEEDFSLYLDSSFSFLNTLDSKERDYLANCILSTVKGRILEDIIMNDCLYYRSFFYDEDKFSVYKFENNPLNGMSDIPNGEFDLVIEYHYNYTVKVSFFEIKHSEKIDVSNQCKHLKNIDLLREIAPLDCIAKRVVLYRGANSSIKNESDLLPSIEYYNIDYFLTEISKKGLHFAVNIDPEDELKRNFTNEIVDDNAVNSEQITFVNDTTDYPTM